jgi:hypothetical protein
VPRIACLHTAESNIPVFDAALRELDLIGIDLHHVVRADLLAEAERAGRLTQAITDLTGEILCNLAVDADAVLLTCSTLGPVIETVAAVTVLRVDAALAHEAVKDGGTVVVLCAVATTMESTRSLFEKAARMSEAKIAVQLVPGAWDTFKAGDTARYLTMIAQAADDAMRAGASRVALAQASMFGAAKLCTSGILPLNSPLAGLKAAVRVATRER